MKQPDATSPDSAPPSPDFWQTTLLDSDTRRWERAARLKRWRWRMIIRSAEALKRLLDIVGSLVGIVLLSPVFIATILLIKLEDRGPIYFRQVRVGDGGRLFRMIKFRSMVVNADSIKDQLLETNQHQQGVTFKMKHDPRVTRVGRWIRKLSIDELPQFFNVLRGEMSLVGPRPPVPREVALYHARHLRRLQAKPGITCLWQIGGRADIDFEGQVRLDLEYIRSQGLWSDIWILLKTVPAVLLGKGAY
jgi:exopolysaccharide biosynthesis polyprenyl glycosylphosphotransferase